MSFVQEAKNRQVIEALISRGIRWEAVRPRSAGRRPLQGKVVTLTGTLETMSPDEAKTKLIELGAKVTSSVSNQTDHVFAGDNPGSKVDVAGQLGIRVCTETDLLELLKSTS